MQYERIQSARIAKRLIDNKLFYGSALHVCYAPEEENLTETRMKLFQRHKDVLKRNTMYIKPSDGSTVFYQDFKSLTRSQLHKKRKMKV